MTDIELLRNQLKRLGLATIAQIFEDEAHKAAKTQVSYTAYLARLAEEELAAKVDRAVNARIAKARLPMLRTLEDFDFSFSPPSRRPASANWPSWAFSSGRRISCSSVDRAQEKPIWRRRWRSAAVKRKRVLCYQAQDLLEQLLEADATHTLGKLTQTLGRLDLLLVDELGYTPMDSRRANLFFQLVNHLYTRVSLVSTTNVAFDSCGHLFGDGEMIAAAILDRLLHFSHVFLIPGPSYRMRGKVAQPTSPQAETAPDTGCSSSWARRPSRTRSRGVKRCQASIRSGITSGKISYIRFQ